MSAAQPGILSPLTPKARYLFFDVKPGAGGAGTLAQLAEQVDGVNTVAGIGAPLVQHLGKTLPGLQSFPDLGSELASVPSTQGALWLWLRGEDSGELFHRSRHLAHTLAAEFTPTRVVDAFVHRDNRDLTGYIDGTENPTGADAEAAAISSADIPGSSFVAVQQWQHDFPTFAALSEADQDDIIGRHRSNNEEFDSAPRSAHVKRTAQESFDPEAFVVRRSMPWCSEQRGGLMFVAFGHSFAAFAAQMRRMSGAEDGVVDGLFQISRPLSGDYYWCPPVRGDGKGLDLSALL